MIGLSVVIRSASWLRSVDNVESNIERREEEKEGKDVPSASRN